MHDHAWRDEPISVKLFFPSVITEDSGDAGVKANQDESPRLIIKSLVMIALHENVSQMCH